MAKTSNINIRIDPDIKEQAEHLFSKFGITITDAINMFLHQSITVGGIPFELKVEKPNAVTSAAMDDAANGKDIHGPFDSVEALMEDLNA